MTGRLYHLEARDKSGVFLGLDVAQCVLVGLGLIAAVLARLAGVPVVVSACSLAAAVGIAKLRFGGRALHAWLPLCAGWLKGSVTGERRWHARLPLAPVAGSGDLPPSLRSVDIVEIEVGDGKRVGAVRQRRAGLLSVVMGVDGPRFAGAETADQDALLARWGEVLAACAGEASPVTQVGWSHQSSASDLSGHRHWASTWTDKDLDAYGQIVDEVAALAVRHQTVVWLTICEKHMAGNGRLLDRAAAALPAALHRLTASLETAGVRPQAPLPVPDLWRLLRQRTDVTSVEQNDQPVPLATRMGLVSGPLAVETSWSHLRIDGAWHRLYWVESWPQRPVPADWLTVFIESPWVTMTVPFRPVNPARSHRRIESQLVKLTAHRARKEDKGRRITEAEHRAEQDAYDLEAELASGHREVLYLGLVAVTGSTLDELDERCRAIEQSARAAQLDLRVLYGRQDVAWAASLPFGLIEPGALELAGI